MKGFKAQWMYSLSICAHLVRPSKNLCFEFQRRAIPRNQISTWMKKSELVTGEEEEEKSETRRQLLVASTDIRLISLWHVSEAHIALCCLLGFLYFCGEAECSCRAQSKQQWSEKISFSLFVCFHSSVLASSVLNSLKVAGGLFQWDFIWNPSLCLPVHCASPRLDCLFSFPLCIYSHAASLSIRCAWFWLALLSPLRSVCFDGPIMFLSQQPWWSCQSSS